MCDQGDFGPKPLRPGFVEIGQCRLGEIAEHFVAQVADGGAEFNAGAAGVVARRLLPGTIILPFLFGMIRLAGEEAGFFSSELATSLFAVADIVTFLLLVAWSARVLRITDRKRAELFVRERDGQKFTSTYNGTLEGRVIKGKIEFKRGDDPLEVYKKHKRL